ncbi:SVEP1-like protein, partial [Mya arenaria]
MQAQNQCGRPPDVQGALPEPEFRDITSFKSGATIQYRCDVKHYLVDLTSWSRNCSDGEWGEVQFRCIVKSCPALNTPDNGQRMDFNYEVGTFAKFTCNTGYEMVGVAQLLCRTDMEWSPKDPPTCKPVRCPDESYLANGRDLRNEEEDLEHHETYKIRCNWRYEMKLEHGRYLGEDETYTRTVEVENLNGALKYGEIDAYTFSCVGKRCFQIDKSKYPNVVIQPKTKYVEHGQSYHLSCENGYEHSLESDPDWTCSYGSLNETILKCTEKPCDTPTIENGVLRNFHKRVHSNPTIVSGGVVSLQCSEGFFLYDNNKNEFMEEHVFNIKCDRGNKTSIPSCKKASGCTLPNDPYASYYVNKEKDKYEGNDTISHEDK